MLRNRVQIPEERVMKISVFYSGMEESRNFDDLFSKNDSNYLLMGITIVALYGGKLTASITLLSVSVL